MTKSGGLIWVPGSFLIGVPARDLTADEVEKHGREWLIESGVYVEPAPKKSAKKPAGKPAKGGST